MAAAIVLTPGATAQEGDANPLVRDVQVETSPPGPAVSLGAFQYASSRVLRAIGEGEPVEAPALTTGGVAVTLRLDGIIVARATMIEHAEPLVAAMDSAVSQLVKKIPPARDAVGEKEYAEKFRRVLISLELAGPLIPVSLATYAEADERLSPGLDGVAARFGERLEAVFPTWMLSTNTSPAEGLRQAISRASGDPALAIPHAADGQPGKLAQTHNATFYRFRVMHLAQVERGANPSFLFRGGRVVDARELTAQTLPRFADALADNLLKRIDAAPKGAAMAGTFWPAQGRFEPAAAGPLERAIAALALNRYAADAGVDPERAKLAEAAAESLVVTLAASGVAGEVLWDDPVVASAWLIAAHETGVLQTLAEHEAIKPARERCTSSVRDSFRIESGYSPSVPMAARGLVAWATVYLSEDPANGVTPETARSAVGSVFRETSAAVLVSQMPWLGWAAIASGGDQGVGASAALRDMRDEVWKHQLTADDVGEDAADMMGGIVFTSTKNPLPNWHGARPLAFLATMVRDPRLTDEKEVLAQVARLTNGLRFLRQLAVDLESAHSARDSNVALGGVRSSLWDQRQPVEATGLTLLVVTETIHSVNALAATEKSKTDSP